MVLNYLLGKFCKNFKSEEELLTNFPLGKILYKIQVRSAIGGNMNIVKGPDFK